MRRKDICKFISSDFIDKLEYCPSVAIKISYKKL